MTDEPENTPPGSPAPAGSPTWPLVLEFAKRMEAKLEKNRHKGDRAGWLQDDPNDLLDRLREEMDELAGAMHEAYGPMQGGMQTRQWAAMTVANEAADVANFAMFLADWYLEHAKSGNGPDQGRRDSDSKQP